ncbi:hypothetical protein SCUCBS95973_008509 [Sporothrix curviconia]|uniref:Zn(2)-C6 fungal-type domain-containing protein n=1 Tax=Sporothrix curviconia TaxID=1260050 RepID=A0ABP0CM55_9PEZI
MSSRLSTDAHNTQNADNVRTMDHLRPMRKFFACDECKRRKIRCSGGDQCANCDRDAKTCRYSSPSQRIVALQRRLQESENVRRRMEQAWAAYLPGVDLATAMRSSRVNADNANDAKNTDHDHDRRSTITATTETTETTEATEATAVDDDASTPQPLPPLPTEHADADDLDFDESEDPERAIDGMAFLTAGPHKSGYTGPQSGIAALKFMQSLPPYLAVTYHPENTDNTSPSNVSMSADDDVPDAATFTAAARARYVDDYFALYHPAYPILHEGTFRARVAGALAKPRDGSWPLLYHAVLAIGAFVSATGRADGDDKDGKSDRNDKDVDLSFFREARRHLGMAVLEKGSLGYVQALTLLANYLQKRNKPNTGFVLIGTAFSMAVAIGLHREFEIPRTSPFTMELRRRTWWTLFVFLSGAQLALGRPAVALSHSAFDETSGEVSVRMPANLDDAELAVDMDQLPPELPEDAGRPTVASCLIEQVRLARLSNQAQAELATHRRPHAATVARLEARIRQWRRRCPPFFSDSGDDNDNDKSSTSKSTVDPRLECPKRVLVWRSLNLRIVLNRPFLFEAIASGAELPSMPEHVVDNGANELAEAHGGNGVPTNPVRSCLMAADECASSICAFLRTRRVVHRGFAWYTTAWLMTASFVQATCLIYMPGHALAPSWRASLAEAAECLCVLGASVDIALRARAILLNVLNVLNHQWPGMDVATDMVMRPETMATLTETGTETETLTDGQTGIGYEGGFQAGFQGGGFQGFQGFQSFQSGFHGGFQDSFSWLAQGQSQSQDQSQDGGGSFVYGNGFDLM